MSFAAAIALLAPAVSAGASGHAAASAFGAEVQVAGQPVVPSSPTATVTTPVGDQTNTVIDIPAAPVVVNGTLTAKANAHRTPDIASDLTVVSQEFAGPYAARALGQIENVGLVYEVAGTGVPLLSAAAIRAEAVAVCSPTPRFAATTEIIDLRIGGTPVPLNAPVQNLIDSITSTLAQTGLNAVVDVQRNVVTRPATGGIAVDGLVVTILSAAGQAPLATVRLTHAEVTPRACVGAPQCSDRADNDGDGVIDAQDPGCHNDGNAANPASYDPNDDDERDQAVASGVLPATGGGTPVSIAAGLLGLGAIGVALRRRLLDGTTS